MVLQVSEQPLAEQYDAIFLDLDGVVYIGPDAVPGAVDAINRLTVPKSFLTNNATRPAKEVADHLRSFGLDLSDEAVVTAGQVVAQQVVTDLGPNTRVLLAGADGLRVALEEAGLVVLDSAHDNPAAVVQGGVVDVRWSQLAEASFAIHAGVPWYSSNPDLTFPTPRGLAPGNGAMVQAVGISTGASPVVAGKPARLIYDQARQRLGANNPLMVGDRHDTDIAGAINAGIASLAVLTGIETLTSLAALSVEQRPTFVAPNLEALHQAHHRVDVTDRRATCQNSVAEVIDGQVQVVSSGGNDLDDVRAALALAWDLLDRGEQPITIGATIEP